VGVIPARRYEGRGWEGRLHFEPERVHVELSERLQRRDLEMDVPDVCSKGYALATCSSGFDTVVVE